MFETSLDLLYIAIALGVILFAIFLSFVLYRSAKLIEETERTVKDVNKKLEKIDRVIDDTIPTITEVNETVRHINSNIIKPVSSIGSVFKKIASFTNAFKGDK